MIGRCEIEASEQEDEVSKETAYALEFFSRFIIPKINVLKQEILRNVQKLQACPDGKELERVGYETQLVTQWGFITRNLKKGLRDKIPKKYNKRIKAFRETGMPEIDCCICYNFDAEDYLFNPLLYCHNCGIYVHKYCYGV